MLDIELYEPEYEYFKLSDDFIFDLSEPKGFDPYWWEH